MNRELNHLGKQIKSLSKKNSFRSVKALRRLRLKICKALQKKINLLKGSRKEILKTFGRLCKESRVIHLLVKSLQVLKVYNKIANLQTRPAGF